MNTPAKPFHLCLLAFLSLFGPFHRAAIAEGTVDPNLTLTITHTNQTVVLKWFASSSAAYQLQSSPTLAVWTNCSLVLAGSGEFLSATFPMLGETSAFFRVQRLGLE